MCVAGLISIAIHFLIPMIIIFKGNRRVYNCTSMFQLTIVTHPQWYKMNKQIDGKGVKEYIVIYEEKTKLIARTCGK